MPRLKPFDKKTSTTYALVHRAQNDPLIHDSEAPSQIFKEINSSSRPQNGNKIRQRGDLEDEFGFGSSIRDNEGEAAEHGIYYDDSKYDYMQHLRDLGGNSGSTWVEPASKGKSKAKQSLEDALSEISLDDDARTVSSQGSSVAWARAGPTRKTYETQQNIPDELAGFQPDMDPRLREVLEALEDEEYVEDDEDIFTELAENGGGELSREDWEQTTYEEDDGWESDETEKPNQEYQGDGGHKVSIPFREQGGVEGELPEAASEDSGPDSSDIPAPTLEDQELLASLSKSKAAAGPGAPKAVRPSKPSREPDAASSSMLSSSTTFGRRKKRKGALTSESGFSMTSSSLARTEPLSVLDSRFDKVLESYMEDEPYDEEGDDDASLMSGMSGLSKMSGVSGMSSASRGSAWGGSQASQAPSLMPSNFDSVLDDFLGGKDGDKKFRPMRKAGAQGRWRKDDGLAQLDEIRSGLGPARISGRLKSQRA